jgi:hypothetical protein
MQVSRDLSGIGRVRTLSEQPAKGLFGLCGNKLEGCGTLIYRGAGVSCPQSLMERITPMKKFWILAALLSLMVFNVGCNQSDADKKAKADKAKIQADADAAKAREDAAAKVENADDKAAQKKADADDKLDK